MSDLATENKDNTQPFTGQIDYAMLEALQSNIQEALYAIHHKQAVVYYLNESLDLIKTIRGNHIEKI